MVEEYEGYDSIPVEVPDPNAKWDGISLGADTRTIEGATIIEKKCDKIHYMAPNVYCCGARTAANTEAITGQFPIATASLLY
ncbi:hypothetical protein I3760_16G074800 [Carya illinoinensis]|nr:hypothetical protein I3760_16G074800 [Carya illinoinensis]